MCFRPFNVILRHICFQVRTRLAVNELHYQLTRAPQIQCNDPMILFRSSTWDSSLLVGFYLLPDHVGLPHVLDLAVHLNG